MKLKIWKAELILFCDDEDKWITRFEFKTNNKEYEINNKFDEWVYSEGWLMDRLPMNMNVEGLTYSTGFKVIQGFDKELSSIELTNLRNEMTALMKKQLNFEKEKYLKEWDNKLRAVCGI